MERKADAAKPKTEAAPAVASAMLKWVPRFPNDTAQVQLFSIYETFHDAASDMSQLESQVSTRLADYREFKDKSHAGRIEAAHWFNYWSPAYREVVGKAVRFVHVSED